jgi:quercetin dioxygenase-like cupin family protein
METSFGQMDIFIKHKVEHLRFTKSGRPHTHDSYESFFVLAGSGKIQIDQNIFTLSKGDFITIAPHSKHWMWPDDNTELEGLILYHQEKLKKI